MKTLLMSGLMITAMVVVIAYGELTEHAYLRFPAESSPQFKWTQVAPPGSGTHQYEWKQGTYPSGIKPLEFNNSLWMIGQKRSWTSADGIHWQAYDKYDWGERISVSQIVFEKKIWATGGMEFQTNNFLNEIWSSADGKTWTRTASTAEWSPRKGHALIVYKNKLWLFGGEISVTENKSPDKLINDIWSSADGIHWIKVTDNAPWAMRGNPQVVVFKGALHLVGGQGMSDVWRSVDGKEWKQLTASSPWKDRYDYGLLVYNDRIWVLGGREKDATNAYNDAWFSTDGVSWHQQVEHAPWTPRSGGNSIAFDKKIWLYGGKHTGHSDSFSGDIWTLEPAHKIFK